MANQHEQAVKTRAYEIWEMEGHPVGREMDHWRQAEEELGAGPSDLDVNPGISTSAGAIDDPEEIEGDNTYEGDVMNDVAPDGSVPPRRRGRTNH